MKAKKIKVKTHWRHAPGGAAAAVRSARNSNPKKYLTRCDVNLSNGQEVATLQWPGGLYRTSNTVKVAKCLRLFPGDAVPAWALKTSRMRKSNPSLSDYARAGARRVASNASQVASAAQSAAARARALAEAEAASRRCDDPTPAQALKVLAKALGVKNNPRKKRR